MPRSSSKSLPPLPIAAAHSGTSSNSNTPLLPQGSGDHNVDNPNATARSRSRSCVTNGCTRTTVTLLVFGAYLVWTWPWYLEHGFDGIPWLGGGGGKGDSESQDSGSRAAFASEFEGEGILRAPKLDVPEGIQTKWGQYAPVPYRALEKYVGPLAGCNVTQGDWHFARTVGGGALHRIGTIVPHLPTNAYTSSDKQNIRQQDVKLFRCRLRSAVQYVRAVERLGSAKTFKDKRLEFFKHYKYNLGSDDLTPFGAAQTFESGQLAFNRHHHLVNDHNIPFVRASSTPRVVDSAGNWSASPLRAASNTPFDRRVLMHSHLIP